MDILHKDSSLWAQSEDAGKLGWRSLRSHEDHIGFISLWISWGSSAHLDLNDTMPSSLILSKINTSTVGSMLIHPSAVKLYNYSLVRTLSYICIDMDILSGILLLKSASLHFVFPAIFLIAIVEILRTLMNPCSLCCCCYQNFDSTAS